MRIKIILSKTLLIALLLCLSGCVAAMFSYKFEEESKMIPHMNIGGWSVSEKIKKDHLYTKQEIIDLLGEPRKSWMKDGYEYLSYGKRELRFSGVTIFAVIVPVPLVLPVGIKDKIVVLKEDRFEKVITIGTTSYSIGCTLTGGLLYPKCFAGKRNFTFSNYPKN